MRLVPDSATAMKKADVELWKLYQQYVSFPDLYTSYKIDSVMKLTSLTSTSLCPLAACWLSLSWLCSFTTSWAAFRRWSSATSSSASNRFTLCSYSRDRSSGIPPSESFNAWTLVFSSRFSSCSLATYHKRNWRYFFGFGNSHQTFFLIKRTSDSWEAIKRMSIHGRIQEISNRRESNGFFFVVFIILILRSRSD